MKTSLDELLDIPRGINGRIPERILGEGCTGNPGGAPGEFLGSIPWCEVFGVKISNAWRLTGLVHIRGRFCSLTETSTDRWTITALQARGGDNEFENSVVPRDSWWPQFRHQNVIRSFQRWSPRWRPGAKQIFRRDINEVFVTTARSSTRALTCPSIDAKRRRKLIGFCRNFDTVSAESQRFDNPRGFCLENGCFAPDEQHTLEQREALRDTPQGKSYGSPLADKWALPFLCFHCSNEMKGITLDSLDCCFLWHNWRRRARLNQLQSNVMIWLIDATHTHAAIRCATGILEKERGLFRGLNRKLSSPLLGRKITIHDVPPFVWIGPNTVMTINASLRPSFCERSWLV